MRVGFTGTREVVTREQEESIYRLLHSLVITEFHHGDCVGADAYAHQVVRELNCARIIIHPPINTLSRAYLRGDVWRANKPYLERNHDIVDETKILVAVPRTKDEEVRSGTWATIRYARKRKRPIYIIHPDGHILVEVLPVVDLTCP